MTQTLEQMIQKRIKEATDAMIQCGVPEKAEHVKYLAHTSEATIVQCRIDDALQWFNIDDQNCPYCKAYGIWIEAEGWDNPEVIVKADRHRCQSDIIGLCVPRIYVTIASKQIEEESEKL